jgi:hypothetical protein
VVHRLVLEKNGAQSRFVFFGDHAFCAERPEKGVAEVDRLLVEQDTSDPMRQMAKLQPGTLFRHPGFHKVV